MQFGIFKDSILTIDFVMSKRVGPFIIIYRHPHFPLKMSWDFVSFDFILGIRIALPQWSFICHTSSLSLSVSLILSFHLSLSIYLSLSFSLGLPTTMTDVMGLPATAGLPKNLSELSVFNGMPVEHANRIVSTQSVILPRSNSSSGSTTISTLFISLCLYFCLSVRLHLFFCPSISTHLLQMLFFVDIPKNGWS